MHEVCLRARCERFCDYASADLWSERVERKRRKKRKKVAHCRKKKKHRRRLTTKEGKFSALCTGFILSNLRVMVRSEFAACCGCCCNEMKKFVNVGDLVRDETIEVPPAALIWDDKDVFFDLLPYSDDSGTSAMELFDM
jgi:hypothetical protein